MQRKIIVTGGTGFIGSHFLNEVSACSGEILAITRGKKQSVLELSCNPKWLVSDLANIEESMLSGYDTLVHLAAHSVSYPFDTLEKCLKYNLIGSLSLFEKARKAGVKRFIVAGSCFEYGLSSLKYNQIPTDAPLEPICSYGTSKALFSIAIRQWALENKLNLEILRIFHVFGPGEKETRFWPSLKKAAETGHDFDMTQGEQVREFMPVLKVAKVFARRAALPTMEDQVVTYNLTTNQPQTLKEFAEQEWQKYSRSSNQILHTLSYRPGEIMRYIPGPNALDINLD